MFAVSFSSLSLSPHTFICFLFEKRKKKAPKKKENKANTRERRKGRHATRPTSAVFFLFLFSAENCRRHRKEKQQFEIRFVTHPAPRSACDVESTCRGAWPASSMAPTRPTYVFLAVVGVVVVVVVVVAVVSVVFRFFAGQRWSPPGRRPGATTMSQSRHLCR